MASSSLSSGGGDSSPAVTQISQVSQIPEVLSAFLNGPFLPGLNVLLGLPLAL